MCFSLSHYRKPKRLVGSCIMVASQKYLAITNTFNTGPMLLTRRFLATLYAHAQNSAGSGKSTFISFVSFVFTSISTFNYKWILNVLDLFSVVLRANRCPICVISTVASISPPTHLRPSWICAKTWASDIPKSYRSASNWNNRIWKRTIRRSRSKRTSRTITKMAVTIYRPRPIPTRSYRRIRPICTAATAA